jgi:hypothetical protein
MQEQLDQAWEEALAATTLILLRKVMKQRLLFASYLGALQRPGAGDARKPAAI